MAGDAGKMNAAGATLLAGEHGRRMRVSLFLAIGLYLPLLGAALWRIPPIAFTSAGDSSTMSIAFAQIASETGGGQAALQELQHAREETPVETASEPVSEAKLVPEPVAEPAPVAKAADKMTDKAPAPRSAVPAKPPVKTVSKSTNKAPTKALGKAPDSPAKAVAAPESKQKSPPGHEVSGTAAAEAAPAPASAGESGVATLVAGETNDPFLALVRRRVEGNVEYPRKARMMRIEGRSVVQFVVASDGALTDLRIYEGSGDALLDNAALSAIRRAQPEWGAPGHVVRLRFPIEFRLRR